MRSIKRSFDYYKTNNKNWSSWTCFATAIQGRKFSKESIRTNFNDLVNKNDYSPKEKGQILSYLYELTNMKL